MHTHPVSVDSMERKREDEAMYRLRVREIAVQKRVSQRQLFLRSGVDIRTIRKIFHDENANVTTETLDALSKVLGVDISDLIESVDESAENM